ncbi:hypothetical protein C7H19_08215 [Aphanothece hegewaldii CCALA 016]|uniref:Chemotaxis protein n=1 Tax=Aphanothece hegewaldii CCALA 016 TaxID=2107694 RepID=A0A2T1LZW5_9CHRO|nr:methyl-accepting chemotaxis protein [Aphanothece hegewaldii]PSF37948.1 hypothetical protein C7H19_08215 [Aphanothece hegewaldii CCALA 016]
MNANRKNNQTLLVENQKIEFVPRDKTQSTTPIVNQTESVNSLPWWSKLSIRTKAILLAIAIGTLPVLTIGGLSYNLSSNAMDEIITSAKPKQVEPLQNRANILKNQLLWLFLLGTGVSSGLLIAIALYLAKRLTNPLQQASETCQQLSDGNLEARLNLMGEDELAILGSNINQMAERIQKLVQDQKGEIHLNQTFGKFARIKTIDEQTKLLTSLLAEIREALNVDRVVVYRFNPDWSGYVAAEALRSPWQSALSERIGDACIPSDLITAYRRGRVKATNNVYQSGFHPEHIELMKRLDIQANLVTPIIQSGNLFGILVAHHCANVHEWQSHEIDFLTNQANQLGIAMTGSLLEQVQISAENDRQENENRQKELLALLSNIEGAAQGDLTVRADITAGEIGIVADFFNAIVENLREIVQQVKSSAEKVNYSIGEKQQAIGELASEASKQAEVIQQSVLFGEQMTISSRKIANKARKASQVAKIASDTAQKSGTMIEKTVANNQQLRSTVAETAKKMKRLGESSQQISKVVSLINQIALKTNLLAVNASIEAARAGEEGRGFAIVAEEVGQLAAQSTSATKEVEQIVDAILLETNEVIKAMEVGTTQVVEESRLVEETKQSLEKILGIAQQIDVLFYAISQETESQNETAQKITQLMHDIAQISQETATSSQEMSNSLEATVAIAQDLQASVSQFKVSG